MPPLSNDREPEQIAGDRAVNYRPFYKKKIQSGPPKSRVAGAMPINRPYLQMG
jgi:hypothetical protein